MYGLMYGPRGAVAFPGSDGPTVRRAVRVALAELTAALLAADDFDGARALTDAAERLQRSPAG